MNAPNSAVVTVPEVLPLVRAYCSIPGNSLGGSLHIVLDDDNTETGHVEFCVNWAAERGDQRGESLARILLAMSRTQRHKLYATKNAPGFRDEDSTAGDEFDALLAALLDAHPSLGGE